MKRLMVILSLFLLNYIQPNASSSKENKEQKAEIGLFKQIPSEKDINSKITVNQTLINSAY